MVQYIRLALLLGYCVALAHCAAAPIDVVYTGDEGCACPTQLGYQLNVPNPPKPKKYTAAEYGYRVEKPVQAKAKISYSFDFTVEEPRTPPPPKSKQSKLYAKVDRITLNKADCTSKHEPSCACSSCSSSNAKSRYVNAKQPQPCKCGKPQCQCNSSKNSKSTSNESSQTPIRFARLSIISPNAIVRRRRDLSSRGSVGALFRKRLLRQQQLQERPQRFVKLYHRDLTAEKQQKGLFGLAAHLPQLPTASSSKRKTKKVPTQSRPLARWLQQQNAVHRLQKRDIKGEYDLLERERANTDLTVPEIIQFMPETLQPNFKRGQCHMGCGSDSSASNVHRQEEEQSSSSSRNNGNTNAASGNSKEQEAEAEAPPVYNSVNAKRAISLLGNQLPLPPLLGDVGGSYGSLGSSSYGNLGSSSYGDESLNYKYVNDDQLRSLLSTTSVPDPLEHSGAPLQFAGDLESPQRYQSWPRAAAAATGSAPLLSAQYDAPAAYPQSSSSNYPVEHVSNAQLDSIISGIVYKHPECVEATEHYGGTLVDPEPSQKKETTDFLKKLINGRLGGWGFDSTRESESALGADYATAPDKTYGYNSHSHHGYSVDTYNVPPITDYLRAWF